jgi:hypothetical protein
LPAWGAGPRAWRQSVDWRRIIGRRQAFIADSGVFTTRDVMHVRKNRERFEKVLDVFLAVYLINKAGVPDADT